MSVDSTAIVHRSASAEIGSRRGAMGEDEDEGEVDGEEEIDEDEDEDEEQITLAA